MRLEELLGPRLDILKVGFADNEGVNFASTSGNVGFRHPLGPFCLRPDGSTCVQHPTLLALLGFLISVISLPT